MEGSTHGQEALQSQEEEGLVKNCSPALTLLIVVLGEPDSWQL